jgi:acyl carrier protein
MFNQVHEILKKIIDVQDIEITEDTYLIELPKWDSFKKVELIIEVEAFWGITLNPEQIENINTIRELISYAKK